MKYLILFKKFMESTQQIAVVEDVFEADKVDVTSCAALVLSSQPPPDPATGNQPPRVTTHVFPPTWWMAVSPADDQTRERASLVQIQ